MLGGGLLTFEKERRNNYILMAMGIIMVVAGGVMLFYVSRAGGIVVMSIGIALLVISMAISNIFFRISMIELLEKRK